MEAAYRDPNHSSAPRSDALSRWLTRAYAINWETVIFIVIFVLAVFTRFAGLGDRVMSHDESLHTQFSYYLYESANFQHDPLMHGPILFHFTALSYFLFGDSDFSARIYPAVLGVLMVMFPLLFRRWLGKWGAILASVMILISPMLMYYNRYIREDTPSIFATLVMVWCVFMYVDGPARWKRKPIFLYVFSGAMLWSLGSKEVAFMYVAIFGLFMTIYWVMRLYQHFFKVPMRTVFQFLIISILLAGVVAMVMYAVLAIAFQAVPVTGRVESILTGIRAVFAGQLVTLEFSAFMTWTLLLTAFMITVMVGTLLWAHRRGNGRFKPVDFLIVVILALAFSLILIFVEERTHIPSSEPEIAPIVTANIPIPATTDANGQPLPALQIAWNEFAAWIGTITGNLPILATWVAMVLLVALLIFSRMAGWWRTLSRFPELDVLWLMGTFILPWVTPIIIKMIGGNPMDITPSGIRVSVAAVVPMLIISTIAGLVWNWKRWIISAAVFYILFAFFFTTMFHNPAGLATGMIGSLGYWLNEQGTRRGSQPQYYYSLVIMPIYEFLPMIGSFLAMCAGMTIFWRQRSDRITEFEEKRKVQTTINEQGEEVPLYNPFGKDYDEANGVRRNPELFGEDRLRRLPFILFVAWWAVFNFIAYTFAGEKMPWLATHITTPMILLTAWYFGRVIEGIEWQKFLARGWLYLLLIPVFGALFLQIIAPFVFGQSPFSGLQQGDLRNTTNWIALVVAGGVLVYLIARVVQFTGMMQFRRMVGVAAFAALGVLTFRAAWMAAFINYDYANEYLVYAHGAPGIKQMAAQIEELSRRTSDGYGMRFAWGGNAWPVTWYLRNLTNVQYFRENPSLQDIDGAVAIYVSADVRSRLEPLLEDRYIRYEYQRMWWPDQEYFNLTPQRVLNALDFEGDDPQAAGIRQGMWDIWWNRDHTRYGEATGRDYSFTNWPVAERMYFYVRRDIAAQVWGLGSGVSTASDTTFDPSAPSVCTTNYQPLVGFMTVNSVPENPFNHVMGLAVNSEGNLYVADEFNNRILLMHRSGEILQEIGLSPDFMLTRPNAVSIGVDGNLYVADTWGFRVVVYSPEGSPLASWGQAVTLGFDALTEPTDGFWAPRDIVTDALGRVYVSDTGNKRVRVYTASGEYLFDVGSGGNAPGQLNEPAGLAIHPDGRLFVADTWNRRISVFNSADGTPLYQFSVLGWYEDLGNRPYLAVDPVRDLIYITDPDAARILVYTTNGTCIGSFGQKGTPDQPLDSMSFVTIGGITLDADGVVYVADSTANRVLAFQPFPLITSPNADPALIERLYGAPAAENPEATPEVEMVFEVTVEAESTVETTDEITPESTP